MGGRAGDRERVREGEREGWNEEGRDGLMEGSEGGKDRL